MKTIWCMFSVDNNYDQPPNNLVAFWEEKPSIELMTKTLGWDFPASDDRTTIEIVNIWSGKPSDMNQTLYRLEKRSEGLQP